MGIGEPSPALFLREAVCNVVGIMSSLIREEEIKCVANTTDVKRWLIRASIQLTLPI